MNNEYIVYWRREVLYRTKVTATSEDEALLCVVNGFSSESEYLEEIDEYGDMVIDNVELLEKDINK